MSEEDDKKHEDEVQEPEPREEVPKKSKDRELGEFERSDKGEEDLT